MIHTLNRFMPVLFATMVFIMLFQFVEDHWPKTSLIPVVVSVIRARVKGVAAFTGISGSFEME